jgi:hypothetical protein
VLGLVDQISSESSRAVVDEFKATGTIAKHSDRQWPQQFDLKAALEGVDKIPLPACRRLVAARGATVSIAATAASVELQDVLRGIGVSPRP